MTGASVRTVGGCRAFFLTHMILISIPELLTILLLAALVPFLGLIVYDFHRKKHHANQDTTKRD